MLPGAGCQLGVVRSFIRSFCGDFWVLSHMTSPSRLGAAKSLFRFTFVVAQHAVGASSYQLSIIFVMTSIAPVIGCSLCIGNDLSMLLMAE